MVKKLKKNYIFGADTLTTYNFQRWLRSSTTHNNEKKYTHRIIKEDQNHRTEGLEHLKGYFERAHLDAKKVLAENYDISLDPLEETRDSIIEQYPKMLDIITLQGYFGEVFAGLIAEHYRPFQILWEIPVFLMRFHLPAFQALERTRQTGENPGKIPGRTGDDCVAFERDSDGKIIRSLICESKCSYDHNSDLIKDGHEKISEPNLRPVDLAQLIAILKDYDGEEYYHWRQALKELLLKMPDNYERYDLLTYVCGRSPVRKETWISQNEPHEKYVAARNFEATEVHLEDSVRLFIQEVYGKRDEG